MEAVESETYDSSDSETLKKFSIDLKLLPMTGTNQEAKVLKATLSKMITRALKYIQKMEEYTHLVSDNIEVLSPKGIVWELLDSIFSNSSGIKERNRLVKSANAKQAQIDVIYDEISALNDEAEYIISLHEGDG